MTSKDNVVDEGKQEPIKVNFINKGLEEDAEWTAHINILNDWPNPDRYLRDIIQYARSGPFYPADMHVDLIEQVFATQKQTIVSNIVEKLPEQEDTDGGFGKYPNGFNDCLDQIKQILTDYREG